MEQIAQLQVGVQKPQERATPSNSTQLGNGNSSNSSNNSLKGNGNSHIHQSYS